MTSEESVYKFSIYVIIRTRKAKILQNIKVLIYLNNFCSQIKSFVKTTKFRVKYDFFYLCNTLVYYDPFIKKMRFKKVLKTIFRLLYKLKQYLTAKLLS